VAASCDDSIRRSDRIRIAGVWDVGEISAVIEALAPLGVRSLDMPATRERVWRALREARPKTSR
jgi:hypothetical protein